MPRLVAALLVVLTLLTTPARADGQGVFAIVDVTLVDVIAGRTVPNQSVYIFNDRIEWVGFNGARPIPPGAIVIQGNDRYLMPGLFDAHVHYTASPDTFGPMMLANGVTAARDTGAETTGILAIRDRLRSGAPRGPMLYVTGAIVDGDPPVWPFSEPCTTADDGRRAVDRLADAGVDQIKVYSRLSKEAYDAIVTRAHERGLHVTGHIPAAVTFDEALAAGQDCNEHLMGFDKLIGELLDGEVRRDRNFFSSFRLWPAFDGVDADALHERLVAVRNAGMVQCPTLVVQKGIARTADPAAADDPRMAYVPRQLAGFWGNGAANPMAGPSGDAVLHMQKMVAALHRAQVPLLVGTDLGNPYLFAGFSVHEEMVLFQEAGIPPADILRSATIIPARFCGAGADLGSIDVSKLASLVLLRDNPLDDIANVASIDDVFVRGWHLDRAALDGLLEEAKAAASGPAPGADAEVAELDAPGEVIMRGRYVMKFMEFDAGTEDFVVSRSDDGFHLRAQITPRGGPQPPSFVSLDLGPDLSFRGATYRTEGGRTTEATYRLDGGVYHAEATDEEPMTLDVPDAWIAGAPANVAEFGLLELTGLDVGESVVTELVSFGFPDWRPSSSPYTVTRLPDTTIDGPDGKPMTVRHYTTKTETPMFDVEGTTWATPDGVPVRIELKLGTMGSMTIVLDG